MIDLIVAAVLACAAAVDYKTRRVPIAFPAIIAGAGMAHTLIAEPTWYMLWANWLLLAFLIIAYFALGHGAGDTKMCFALLLAYPMSWTAVASVGFAILFTVGWLGYYKIKKDSDSTVPFIVPLFWGFLTACVVL